MRRYIQVAMVMLLLWMSIFPAMMLPPTSRITRAAGAAPPLHVSALLRQVKVAQGEDAHLFVRTGAFVRLTLKVSYTGSLISTMFGATDRRGRFTFRWRIPAGLHVAGIALLRLTARRGASTGQWSGKLTITGPQLPPVFVAPLRTRVTAGERVGFFVSTTPRAAVQYTIAAGRIVLARGVGQADAAGRLVVWVVEPTLLHAQTVATITVTVGRLPGVRTRSAHVLIEPRPPLALKVTPLSPVFRAGLTLGLSIESVPGASLTVTVTVTSTIVAQGTGVIGSDGHYTFSTGLNLMLRQPHKVQIVVQARHGMDNAREALVVLLQPGVPGQIVDALNSASNPAPNLSQYLGTIPDKVIMVSTESQTMRLYQDGTLVHESYVTTGRPELPTVRGIFHVYAKVTPFEFISPWPTSSPWYYPPSWVKYWMPFYGGYGLHDAPWRTVYGPGTNLPHYDTDPGEPVGSHGCVNIPLADMIWLWNWASVGTTVVVY